MASVDGSHSLQKTSDECHTYVCGPCKTDNIERAANYYCDDCPDYLCDDCKDHHGKLRPTRNHGILSRSQVPAVSFIRDQSAIAVFCRCNKNQEVKFFCDVHQDIVCESCKDTIHYKCKVSLAQDECTSYNTSSINTVVTNIETLKEEYVHLKERRIEDSKLLERSEEECKAAIKAFRKDLENFFDNLEKSILKLLDSHKIEEQRRIDQHILTITASLKMLDADQNVLQDVISHNRKRLMFAADVQVSKSLQDYAARLSDIGKDVIDTSINFARNTKLVNLQAEIDSFGSLKTKEIMLYKKIKSQTQISVQTSGDWWKPCITGTVVMESGDIIMCDFENKELKLVKTPDHAVKDSLKLNANPLDICAFDPKRAIVTLPHLKQLQYIEGFPRLAPGHVIQLNKKCWGVYSIGNKIYTSCHNNPGEGEIRVLDLNGNLLKQIGINSDGTYMLKSPTYITVSTSEKIFVSDRDGNAVTCLSMDNRVIYQYRDIEMNTPRRSYCDGGDNILVCGQNSSNVQVITSEGKKHTTLLSAKDGLENPRTISYRESDSTLVLGFNSSDHILFFKCGN